MLISHEEAAKFKPAGWDVFKKTHLMYMEGINRDFSVAELNYEAYKIFADTILIQRSDSIISDQNRTDEFIKSGKQLGVDDYPWPYSHLVFGRARNYEYLKIGSGFELSLKAQMLGSGYVVHEIDKKDLRYSAIASEQKDRPIKIDELMEISGYMYNGINNILPGIKEKSLQFSLIVENINYRKIYQIEDQYLDVISDYKDLRNSIHLPGDPVETDVLKNMSFRDQIYFIQNFVYEYIVMRNRSLVAKHGLHKALEIEEYDFNKAMHGFVDVPGDI